MTLTRTFNALNFIENILLTKYKISTLLPTVTNFMTLVAPVLVFVRTVLLRMRLISASKTFENISAFLSLVRFKTDYTNLLTTVVFGMTGFFTF